MPCFGQPQAAGDLEIDLAIIDNCNSESSPFRAFVGGGADVR